MPFAVQHDTDSHFLGPAFVALHTSLIVRAHPGWPGIPRRDSSSTMKDLEGSGLTRADDPIARHEMHHVCQSLHARSTSRSDAADRSWRCGRNIACSTKMRARAGRRARAYASAVPRWSVMIESKDRMLDGKPRTVNRHGEDAPRGRRSGGDSLAPAVNRPLGARRSVARPRIWLLRPEFDSLAADDRLPRSADRLLAARIGPRPAIRSLRGASGR